MGEITYKSGEIEFPVMLTSLKLRDKTMETVTNRILPMSIEELRRDLRPEEPTNSSSILLIDIRPNAQFCNGHIESAENVNFSNILLRRLLKGVVSIESFLPSRELAQKICKGDQFTGGTDDKTKDQKLIVYDWCSNDDGVKVELAKHAEVLATASNTGVIYFLNGEASCQWSPQACTTT